MIAYAVLELTPHGDGGVGDAVMDWAQLVWPYLGFLSIVVLCCSHVLIGLPPLPTRSCGSACRWWCWSAPDKSWRLPSPAS